MQGTAARSLQLDVATQAAGAAVASKGIAAWTLRLAKVQSVFRVEVDGVRRLDRYARVVVDEVIASRANLGQRRSAGFNPDCAGWIERDARRVQPARRD